MTHAGSWSTAYDFGPDHRAVSRFDGLCSVFLILTDHKRILSREIILEPLIFSVVYLAFSIKQLRL